MVAEHDGVITNLKIETGTYANAGNPLVALVGNRMDVIADFREKSLRNRTPNHPALIAFDSQPGQVFTANIRSIDAGVSAGQFDANGQLANRIEPLGARCAAITSAPLTGSKYSSNTTGGCKSNRATAPRQRFLCLVSPSSDPSP